MSMSFILKLRDKKTSELCVFSDPLKAVDQCLEKMLQGPSYIKAILLLYKVLYEKNERGRLRYNTGNPEVVRQRKEKALNTLAKFIRDNPERSLEIVKNQSMIFSRLRREPAYRAAETHLNELAPTFSFR